MAWFLDDAGRLAREKAAIELLDTEADWVRGVVWGLSGGLHLDAVIRARGHDYEITMAYPEVFPAAPPIVKPINSDERWSGHQWGAGGSLLSGMGSGQLASRHHGSRYAEERPQTALRGEPTR